MLTEQQRIAFCNATAEFETGYFDEDGWACEPESVVATRDTIEAFTAAWGRPKAAQTEAGTLHVWERLQKRPGTPRGTLYVLDFGDARASYFTA